MVATPSMGRHRPQAASPSARPVPAAGHAVRRDDDVPATAFGVSQSAPKLLRAGAPSVHRPQDRDCGVELADHGLRPHEVPGAEGARAVRACARSRCERKQAEFAITWLLGSHAEMTFMEEIMARPHVRSVRIATACSCSPRSLAAPLGAQGAAEKTTICLAPATAQMASGSSADGATAVRETLGSYLTGPTLAVDAAPARSRRRRARRRSRRRASTSCSRR